MTTRHEAPRAAFTFVEVLASLAFMAILLPAVVGALTLANRASLVAERTAIAAELGENRLSEMLIADAWTSAETRGDFGEDRPGYRWELRQSDWTEDTMTELQMDVFFTVQGREHSVRLTTLVSESLTEP